MLSAAFPAYAKYYQWEVRTDQWSTFNVKNKPQVKIHLIGKVYENASDEKLVRACGTFYYIYPDDYWNYGCYASDCYVRATVENFWRRPYADTGRVYGKYIAMAETTDMKPGKAHVYCGRY